MDGAPLLAAGLVAIFGALALALATIGAITGERQQVGRSLAALRAIETAPREMRRELEQPFAERILEPVVRRFISLSKRYTAAGNTERVRGQLDAAGNPTGWDVERVLAFKLLAGVAALLLSLLLSATLGVPMIIALGIVIVATALGYYTPDLVLYQLAYNRRERIRKTLPDALDLLSISVEAGLGFDAAVAQVARNTDGPLSEEFFRVLQEQQIGLGRAEAIRAMGERTDLPELRSFTTAMVQADAFGIPIANVLRVQSRELRLKRSQRAEEQAQKVPVKILFPLIFFILPSLFVVVVGPAAISIIRNLA